jgi:putative DNA methylase
MTLPLRKLIEVAMPLEAINREAAREKSIRHGHPSTLHLWWARRPLAACRAVIFAQYVDDPSSYIDDEGEADRERQRLLNLIERLVPWEASTDMAVISSARLEIARSWERSHGGPPLGTAPTPEEVDAYLGDHVAAFCDPFCGGGSLVLEARRLGLRAFGSDKNPVAVLITKALVEIPPRFANMPPVNPRDRDQLAPARKARRRPARAAS